MVAKQQPDASIWKHWVATCQTDTSNAAALISSCIANVRPHLFAWLALTTVFNTKPEVFALVLFLESLFARLKIMSAGAAQTLDSAASQAQARLQRLDRLSSQALSQFGTLLHLSKIKESGASDADAAVEGAQIRGAALSLASAVEGLLELVQEVKLDAALTLGTSAPSAAGIAASASGSESATSTEPR